MNRTIRRTLVGLAGATALVVAMASPASAATVTVSLSSGSELRTYDQSTTPPTLANTFPLDGSTCGGTTATVDVDLPGSGAIDLTSLSGTGSATVGGTAYVVEFTGSTWTTGSASGSISSFTFSGLEILVEAKVSTVGSDACDPGTEICTVGGLGVVSGSKSSGTFTAAAVDIAGGLAPTNGTCSGGIQTIIGQTWEADLVGPATP